MTRMLVEKVPVSCHLFVIQFGHELHMCTCRQVCPPHSRSVVAPTVVEPLPRGELGTHGRSYQQDWTLFFLHASCLVPFLLDVEVPWLAVVRVDDGKIQRESRCEISVSALLELLRHAGRGVDLGYKLSATLGGFTAV